MQLLEAFYRTGSLVFGGGHVVLPLLNEAVVRPGWVNAGDFLAGYGAAQTIPGPLFTFAAYLGFAARTNLHGIPGAVLCLLCIFLPGLLLAAAAALVFLVVGVAFSVGVGLGARHRGAGGAHQRSCQGRSAGKEGPPPACSPGTRRSPRSSRAPRRSTRTR